MTPQDRTDRARLAAHLRWANCDDRRAALEPALRGQARAYERQVDPDGLLDPQERSKRAHHAQLAHMARMRLARTTRKR